MIDSLFSRLVHRLASVLVGALILASGLHPSPVRAHVGISEEIREITSRIQENPDSPELYLQRGDVYRISGHWTEAIADFNKVQLLSAGNAAADIGMGRTFLDQGEYKKAKHYLDRALEKEPDNVRALVSRARTLRFLGQPLAAAADYSRAINVFQEPDKPLPEYYFEQAQAYAAAGRESIGMALQTLDAGIDRLGALRVLEDYAIALERQRKNYNAALVRLDRVIDRSARKAALLLKRGEILLEAGRPKEAKEDFATARAEIDSLPSQRRHTRKMKKLRTDIGYRMHTVKHEGGRE
jgi:tetratricopeptide (TPR) repeat protein